MYAKSHSSEWFKLINKHYSIQFFSKWKSSALLFIEFVGEKTEKILKLNIPKTRSLTIAKTKKTRENKN